MSDKAAEKWSQMVSNSIDAVETFYEFLDDKAIIYAADRIKELESTLKIIKNESVFMAGKLISTLNSSDSADVAEIIAEAADIFISFTDVEDL